MITHLGMFGPGVGVLYLANRIHHDFPQLKITCFSDLKNSPYSSKDPTEVCALVHRAIEVLTSQRVCQILAGCNTSSLFLREVIQERVRSGNVTPDALNLIDLTVAELKKQALGNKVILLGSPLLSKARYYTEKLTNLSVIEEGLSGIASDVDRNLHTGRRDDYRALLRSIYKKHPKIDSVVIVCTHFEAVADLIEEEASAVYHRQIPVYLQSDLVLGCLKGIQTCSTHLKLDQEQPAKFTVLTNDTSDKYLSYVQQICPGALIAGS